MEAACRYRGVLQTLLAAPLVARHESSQIYPHSFGVFEARFAPNHLNFCIVCV